MKMFGEFISFFLNYFKSFLSAVRPQAIVLGIALIAFGIMVWWESFSCGLQYPTMSPMTDLSLIIGGLIIIAAAFMLGKSKAPENSQEKA